MTEMCLPGGVISRSLITVAGADSRAVGVGTVLQWGDIMTVEVGAQSEKGAL